MTDASPATLLLAPMFKAAGDPMRLGILRIMRRDSFGVLELCKVFSVQQPSMSHHLKVLAKAGLVVTRREGNSIFYRRSSASEDRNRQMLASFFELLDSEPLDQELIAAVAKIQAMRRSQATEFFRMNADRFREQQDLIAGHKEYGGQVAKLLARDSRSSWLEVGPGDGSLLRDCAGEFAEVTALDVSQELIEKSAQNLPDNFREKVKFVHSETSTALKEGRKADVISCNMVLHHVPSPAGMVSDLAGMLKPGGQLLLTDLDQHDQDWAREACGDLWLGFPPEQLNEWAEAVGLAQGRSDYLALRNGFGVQIREYLKSGCQGA